MSWLDLVLVIILALLAFDGWRHGILHFISEFIALCLGIIVALLLYKPFAEKLGFISASGVAEIVAFIIICAIVTIAAAILCHYLLEPRIKLVITDRINRLSGLALGLVLGMALCIFIVLLLDKYVAVSPETALEEISGIRQSVTTALKDSIFANPIIKYFGFIL
jgi:uncharacterized membrane protein required for colicin V production